MSNTKVSLWKHSRNLAYGRSLRSRVAFSSRSAPFVAEKQGKKFGPFILKIKYCLTGEALGGSMMHITYLNTIQNIGLEVRMNGRMLRRGCAALLTVVLIGAGLAACGSDSDSDSNGSKAKGPFEIYMSADQSGPTKSYTEAEIGGMEAAIEVINKDGGIEGRKVKLETVDDANDPTKAVNLLQKRLSGGDKPDLVYAGGSSAVTMSMLPVLTRNKVSSLSASSAVTINDPKKFPYHFGDVFSTDAYVTQMIDEAEKNGYKKVAMLHSNDTSGQAAVGVYKEEFAKTDVKFVDAGFDPSALDMTPQLNKLKAGNPDALLISGYGTAALYGFKSRAKIGWDIPTYADQLASTFPLASQMKPEQLKNVKVIVGNSSLASSEKLPALEKMVEHVKAGKYAKSLQGVGVAVYIIGYDVPALYAYAAKQAGSTDVEKVTKAMENLKDPSGNPPWLQSGAKGDAVKYNYSSTNHFPTAGKNALHYVKPGTNNADGFYEPGK